MVGEAPGGSPATVEEDLSFLALPNDVCDWRKVLLYAAAEETGLLSVLPGTVDQVAGRVEVDARAVRIALEALALWGLVEEGADKSYRVGTTAPAADTAAVLRLHAGALRQWSDRLSQRLRSSTAAAATSSALYPDVFLRALAVTARRAAREVADACLARAPGSERVLDLGGGHGEYAMEFARRGLRVTLQDRPAVIDAVRRFGQLTTAGVSLFPGDFFETLPDESFDLIFCSGVLDTYDGERNRELCRRVRTIISPGGHLVLASFLRGRHPAATLFAVQALLGDQGGDTHSLEDYRGWLREAGYGPPDVIDIDDRRHTLLVMTA